MRFSAVSYKKRLSVVGSRFLGFAKATKDSNRFFWQKCASLLYTTFIRTYIVVRTIAIAHIAYKASVPITDQILSYMHSYHGTVQWIIFPFISTQNTYKLPEVNHS